MNSPGYFGGKKRLKTKLLLVTLQNMTWEWTVEETVPSASAGCQRADVQRDCTAARANCACVPSKPSTATCGKPVLSLLLHPTSTCSPLFLTRRLSRCVWLWCSGHLPSHSLQRKLTICFWFSRCKCHTVDISPEKKSPTKMVGNEERDRCLSQTRFKFSTYCILYRHTERVKSLLVLFHIGNYSWMAFTDNILRTCHWLRSVENELLV